MTGTLIARSGLLATKLPLMDVLDVLDFLTELERLAAHHQYGVDDPAPGMVEPQTSPGSAAGASGRREQETAD
jgi:hypothetical protein